MVIKKSGRPNLATNAMASRYDWCSARGLPPNDAGKITGAPTDLLSLVVFFGIGTELYEPVYSCGRKRHCVVRDSESFL